MRIGHYSPRIRHDGGVASYIKQIAEGQVEAGHEVALLERFRTHSKDDEGLTGTSDVVGSEKNLFEKADELQLDILNVHELVHRVPAGRLAVVRTLHGHRAYCPSGSKHLRRTNLPCERTFSVRGCLWGHFADRCGSIRPQNLQHAFLSTRTEQRVLPQIETVVVSRFLKEEMVRAGYPGQRIHVLHSPAPPIATSYHPLPEGPPRFIFVGRVVPEKGLDILLRAMSRLERYMHLDVLGDGYILEDMRKLAERLGIAGRVIFHGWCAPEKVRSMTLRARALVFPSTWHEPAGLVTLEAAALGRPVIAARVGGIPEYADECFSIIVPPADPRALADAILRLAKNPVMAERMGRAGRDFVQQQSSRSDYVRKLDAVYRVAVQNQESRL